MSLDWKNCLSYALEAMTVRGDKLALDDVDSVVKCALEGPGPDDGLGEGEFVWLLKLKSGKFASVEAWHDYTGWDCQSGATICVGETLEHVTRFGLTAQGRSMLDMDLEEDK